MDNTNWKCWVCCADNEVEVATNKRKLTCRRCESVYLVTGQHIDGRPMIGLLKARPSGPNLKAAIETGPHKPLVSGSTPLAATRVAVLPQEVPIREL